VCRLALPYTQNAAALSEMARVLRPAGRLILKIHHARFYFRRLWFALQHGSARMACSSAKVLLNGIFFHLTGRQPRPQFFSEVFQTRWMLRRILTPLSLQITEEMKNSDSNSRTPIFIIAKHPGA
jgi:ubiquinone/menaquinone biosynthesis C-methylase UbiE